MSPATDSGNEEHPTSYGTYRPGPGKIGRIESWVSEDSCPSQPFQISICGAWSKHREIKFHIVSSFPNSGW